MEEGGILQSGPPMLDPRRLRSALARTAGIVALGLPLLGALRTDFFWDDWSIVALAHRARVPEVLGHDLWSTYRPGYFRPLTSLALVADRWFWGTDPSGYHLHNLLLHLACAALVARLSRSLAAAALFLWLPTQATALHWVVGRLELLSAALALGALAARRRAAVALPLYAAALLAKESAALLAPALALRALLRRRPRELLATLPWFALPLALVALRPGARAAAEGLWASFDPRNLLWPVLQLLSPEGTGPVVRIGLPLLLVLALARARLWPLAAALLLALPAALFARHPHPLFDTRFLYLPAAFLAIAAGTAVARSRLALPALLAAAALGLAGQLRLGADFRARAAGEVEPFHRLGRLFAEKAGDHGLPLLALDPSPEETRYRLMKHFHFYYVWGRPFVPRDVLVWPETTATLRAHLAAGRGPELLRAGLVWWRLDDEPRPLRREGPFPPLAFDLPEGARTWESPPLELPTWAYLRAEADGAAGGGATLSWEPGGAAGVPLAERLDLLACDAWVLHPTVTRLRLEGALPRRLVLERY
jgi:hypothetical protein